MLLKQNSIVSLENQYLQRKMKRVCGLEKNAGEAIRAVGESSVDALFDRLPQHEVQAALTHALHVSQSHALHVTRYTSHVTSLSSCDEREAAAAADSAAFLLGGKRDGVMTTVARYTSHVTRYTSHVTRHTSHVTRHL
jgi:hypothetical protein